MFVQTHQQRNGGCSAQPSPVPNKERIIPPVHLKQSTPSVGPQPSQYFYFSKGGLLTFAKSLHTRSFQTLLSHFPWAGNHFRCASWDSAPGLIPAPMRSFMSQWAGWSCGTLQRALMQVVLGKVLPDFCKEVESNSVRADWWQTSDFQFLLMFMSWWVSGMFKNIFNACGSSQKWYTIFAYFLYLEF